MNRIIKKLISVFFILVLFVLIISPVVSALALGDGDKDGVISASDARLALRLSVKLEYYPVNSVEYKTFDVDKDGSVTASDARLILRKAVGLDSYPDAIVDEGQSSWGDSNKGGYLNTVYVPGLTNDKNSANYVVNVNSMKFHHPKCSSVGDMANKNTAYSKADRNTLIANGFSPCGRCKP